MDDVDDDVEVDPEVDEKKKGCLRKVDGGTDKVAVVGRDAVLSTAVA